MYLGEFARKTVHYRKSKTGKLHQYYRTQRIVKLKCDCCEKEFSRSRRTMNPARLNNNVFHVCNDCDAKRFAQKRGVEKRQMWSLTASSSLPISKL